MTHNRIDSALVGLYENQYLQLNFTYNYFLKKIWLIYFSNKNMTYIKKF